VLHEPEIPNNTGNIGRSCVALGSHLHLIHPLGFEISEKACRRAGLDYWPRLSVQEHAHWDAYLQFNKPNRRWLFTTKSKRNLFDVQFLLGDHLVFGKETAGLPASVLEADPERCVSLPMVAGERSLNLATAVCAAMVEGVRQLRVQGQIGLDEQGRLCWK
jgi:tRNA (cytidine/uridine-2'-O-)-methyltransferase